ncbi:MAG: signal peptidase I [Sedimentisphaerales bacterium]|nr:signal peptidase I [Sedimentisphaerales bacterium]
MAKKTQKPAPASQGIIDRTYHFLEWALGAFSFTLVFIVFVMQAYTIPTGSMADTLKGAHFRLQCRQCGYPYDFDYLPDRNYGRPDNTTHSENIPIIPNPPRCPSCGFYREPLRLLYRRVGDKVVYQSSDAAQRWDFDREHVFPVRRAERVKGPDGKIYTLPIEEFWRWQDPGQLEPVMKGDRIFVLKSLYQFAEPRRWDVVVFKNPLEPRQNYIKRMIGLPGEKIEIIDGDIYVNDELARKPERVQNELWMPVYDNDFQPVKPDVERFNGHAWKQPFANVADSEWKLNPDNMTVFRLHAGPDKIHTISYNPQIGNDFRASYAYDDPEGPTSGYERMPICSDLQVSFYVEMKAPLGRIGAGLSKYGVRYQAIVDASGMARLEQLDQNGAATVLQSAAIDLTNVTGPARFCFANVDHQLILQYGDNTILHDMGKRLEAMGPAQEIMPEITLIGAGSLELSHIRLHRDIHYISNDRIERAGPGNPFLLGDDEFFVCGDNSPNSLDARLWPQEGIGNLDPDGTRHMYRAGTVPRDYLVGKAFFVYWPGPYKPYNNTPIARWMDKNRLGRLAKIFLNIPCIDGMKFIYGGGS